MFICGNVVTRDKGWQGSYYDGPQQLLRQASTYRHRF